MKNFFNIEIAGFIIEIKFKKRGKNPIEDKLRRKIKKYFKEFLVSKKRKADFIIHIEESRQYYFLKKKSLDFILFQKHLNNREILTFSHLSKFQFEIIISMIVNKLLFKKGFFFHASAVAHKKEAFIFTGQPGAGKSTIMKLLSKDFLPLADDRVIIKKENGQYFVYQFPFTEKASWIKKSPEKYKLKEIFFLKKAKKPEIKKIKNNHLIFIKIINQLIIEKKYLIQQHYKFVFNFILEKIPISYLYFPKNKETIDFFKSLSA